MQENSPEMDLRDGLTGLTLHSKKRDPNPIRTGSEEWFQEKKNRISLDTLTRIGHLYSHPGMVRRLPEKAKEWN